MWWEDNFLGCLDWVTDRYFLLYHSLVSSLCMHLSCLHIYSSLFGVECLWTRLGSIAIVSLTYSSLQKINYLWNIISFYRNWDWTIVLWTCGIKFIHDSFSQSHNDSSLNGCESHGDNHHSCKVAYFIILHFMNSSAAKVDLSLLPWSQIINKWWAMLMEMNVSKHVFIELFQQKLLFHSILLLFFSVHIFYVQIIYCIKNLGMIFSIFSGKKNDVFLLPLFQKR